jgi:hypothetical protein
MFKNLDNDSDTEARHTRSWSSFREVPLANLFMKNYGDKGFYSEGEEDLTNKDYLESTRPDKVKTEEIHQGEP